MVDDVKTFGCSLSYLTAFLFENLLGKIKRNLRSGFKPLEQFCNRLEGCEEFSQPDKKILYPGELSILKCVKKNNELRIQKLKFKNYELRTKEPNNRVFMNDGSIVEIESIIASCTDPQNVTVNNIKIFGKKFKIRKPAYSYPCNSTLLSTFLVQEPTEKKKQ